MIHLVVYAGHTLRGLTLTCRLGGSPWFDRKELEQAETGIHRNTSDIDQLLIFRRVVPFEGRRVVRNWGDIDTRLRNRLPIVRSMLMEAETLVAHSGQWVVEPTPTNRPLRCLTLEESSLYTDLVEDRDGRSIRLEQERVRFSLVETAVRKFIPPVRPG
jgi:hypothetical protein